MNYLNFAKSLCFLTTFAAVFLLFTATEFQSTKIADSSTKKWVSSADSEEGKNELTRNYNEEGYSTRSKWRANKTMIENFDLPRSKQYPTAGVRQQFSSYDFGEEFASEMADLTDDTTRNTESNSRNQFVNPRPPSNSNIKIILGNDGVKTMDNYYGIIKRGQNYKVIYNAVPKTGSRTLFRTLQYSLNSSQDTRHVPFIKINRRYRGDESRFMSFINQVKAPALLRGHVPFSNLPSDFLYINMIRDPLERFVSEYYFMRNGDSLIPARSSQLSHGYDPHHLPEGWNDTLDECVRKQSELCHPNSGIMKLFCGFSPSCNVANRWTFNHALFNLDRYTVVGLTDQLESTLAALEKLLPDLVAKDTAKVLEKRNEELSKYQTINRNEPTETTKAILRSQMAHEFEFYEEVRKRFKKLKKKLGIS